MVVGQQKKLYWWGGISTVLPTPLHYPHIARLAKLHSLLASVLQAHRLSRKRSQQILGELRSMFPALPGSRGLLSLLQHALATTSTNRIRVTQAVKDFVLDFQHLAACQPYLTPHPPPRTGSLPPCLRWGLRRLRGWHGRGLVPDQQPAPLLLWRAPFPVEVVAAALVSDANPNGTITNSDLELLAIIAHQDVLAQHHPVAELTTASGSDNTAAVAWQQNGSTTTAATRAYLLRLSALHQRHHRYVQRIHYIPGPANVMADDASRLWHLSDDALLTHFSTTYPQPASWTLCLLNPDMNSALICALSKKRHLPASLHTAPPPLKMPGPSGHPSAPNTTSTPALPPTQIPSPASKSSLIATAPVALPPAVNLSGLWQWRLPYAISARQTLASLGSPDPRLNAFGHIDFRLQRQQEHGYAKHDPPPTHPSPASPPYPAHCTPQPPSPAGIRPLWTWPY